MIRTAVEEGALERLDDIHAVIDSTGARVLLSVIENFQTRA